MTVTADEVPRWLAEAVARAAHDRGCLSEEFRSELVPDFDTDGVHRNLHTSTARNYVADLCNAFEVTPDDLHWLMDGPA